MKERKGKRKVKRPDAIQPSRPFDPPNSPSHLPLLMFLPLFLPYQSPIIWKMSTDHEWLHIRARPAGTTDRAAEYNPTISGWCGEDTRGSRLGCRHCRVLHMYVRKYSVLSKGLLKAYVKEYVHPSFTSFYLTCETSEKNAFTVCL